MDIDNIKDIEILKTELKKYMRKCIKSFTRADDDGFNPNIKFEKGMYYYLHGGSLRSDDGKYSVSLSFDELRVFFE